MSAATSARVRSENADAVGLVVALLVRFPEIATIVSHPGGGTIVLSFVVNRRLDGPSQHALRQTLVTHVSSLHELSGSDPATLVVAFERDERVTFVRVTRDAASLSRDELVLLTTIFAERFGDALLRSPLAEEPSDEDPAADDELVEYAIEALRDPSQQKSLVGFREEKRVLVYFLKTRKKAKAAGRS
jgi:hypothetical protein